MFLLKQALTFGCHFVASWGGFPQARFFVKAFCIKNTKGQSEFGAGPFLACRRLRGLGFVGSSSGTLRGVLGAWGICQGRWELTWEGQGGLGLAGVLLDRLGDVWGAWGGLVEPGAWGLPAEPGWCSGVLGGGLGMSWGDFGERVRAQEGSFEVSEVNSSPGAGFVPLLCSSCEEWIVRWHQQS